MRCIHADPEPRQAVSPCPVLHTSPAAPHMYHVSCSCPFCQRDSFWVEFAGVPVEDAHIIHATTISATAATSSQDAQQSSQPHGVAAAAGGGTVPPPSPVVTASVAQRRALEAQLEAQHQHDLAADLQRARESSPQSRPMQHVRSSPLTDGDGPRFSLPRASSAASASGSSRMRAAIAAHAAARRHRNEVDRFERYTRDGGRQVRGGRGSRGGGYRGHSSLAEALSASTGSSARDVGGDEDMDVLERMMLMQAMRASLADSGGTPAHRSAPPSHAESQPVAETPVHGLLQVLDSLMQAAREAPRQRGDSGGGFSRRHSSSSIDD